MCLSQMQRNKQRFTQCLQNILSETNDDDKDCMCCQFYACQLFRNGPACVAATEDFLSLTALGELWCHFEEARLFLPKTWHLCHLQGEYMSYSAVPMS